MLPAKNRTTPPPSRLPPQVVADDGACISSQSDQQMNASEGSSSRSAAAILASAKKSSTKKRTDKNTEQKSLATPGTSGQGQRRAGRLLRLVQPPRPPASPPRMEISPSLNAATRHPPSEIGDGGTRTCTICPPARAIATPNVAPELYYEDESRNQDSSSYEHRTGMRPIIGIPTHRPGSQQGGSSFEGSSKRSWCALGVWGIGSFGLLRRCEYHRT